MGHSPPKYWHACHLPPFPVGWRNLDIKQNKNPYQVDKKKNAFPLVKHRKFVRKEWWGYHHHAANAELLLKRWFSCLPVFPP